jgi:Kef-type K+ transport system membrane component KefB
LTAQFFGLPLFWEGIFIGAILTATSVSISAQTLIELGALRSKEGSTILGAAVIDDVMGIIVLSVVVAFARAADGAINLTAIVLIAARMAAFFAVAVLAGRWFTPLAAAADRLGVSQVAGYGIANGIITQDVFSASVIMVLVTTMVTPPLLRLTFPREAAGATPAVVEETVAGPPEEANGHR